MSTPWLHEHAGHITLTLHIQPGAKKTEVVGLYGDALKIRLAAPPVDGQANAALIAFIAQKLKLKKSALRLKSGQSSRRKLVEVDGVNAELLGSLLAGIATLTP